MNIQPSMHIQTNDIAVKETEINKVMNNLGKTVEYLIQLVEAIEVRLMGITRNSRPAEVEGKEQDKPNEILYDEIPYETNLAQNINKIHDKIQGLRKRLDDFLNRIEL